MIKLVYPHLRMPGRTVKGNSAYRRRVSYMSNKGPHQCRFQVDSVLRVTSFESVDGSRLLLRSAFLVPEEIVCMFSFECVRQLDKCGWDAFRDGFAPALILATGTVMCQQFCQAAIVKK